MRKKTDLFRANYLSGNHIFAVGYNHRTIRDSYRGIYSEINITVNSWYAWDEKEWNINTCDKIYQCPKCKKGGMEVEEMIDKAEEKGGKIDCETILCSNNQCNNSWSVSVILKRKI